ncbi:conserved domain protein [Prevotella denticola CRIS 18C-A]|uniref:Conserved domain protein n=1 Tax=Prevotella denticola CRIS 18C-A TaxID=944557 RepID=F0HAY3_9BACT|nr:conserved domain protein [Prevotella denticola CRIS 18C-A]
MCQGDWLFLPVLFTFSPFSPFYIFTFLHFYFPHSLPQL